MGQLIKAIDWIGYFVWLCLIYPVMLYAFLSSPEYNKYRYFHGDLWEEIKEAQRRKFGL